MKKIIRKFLLERKKNKEYKQWLKNDCPVPPPHLVKQLVIKELQKLYNYKYFIETGTFLGEMVDAQKNSFDKIISIELGKDLFEKAKQKFCNDKNVVIYQGDSGKVLVDIMKDVKEPAIFWLDGHYSAGITAKGEKDCPIFEELDAIFQNSQLNHILLIDDARCFIGEQDYPSIKVLSDYIQSKNSKYIIEVKDDVIRALVK